MSSSLRQARHRRNRPVIYGRERAQLHQLLDDAMVGHGSLAIVSGVAGIGKTTLVRDLEDRALKRSMLVLSGYCYDLAVTPPYQPWIHIARASTQIDGIPSPPDAFQHEEALQQSQSKQALFHEIERFLVAIAGQQPLVVILEDLHWSDQESLEFLRWFGRPLAHLRLLIVITYRDDELTRRHALYEVLPTLLVRETPAHRINLRPLDDPAVRSLVSSRYGLPEAGQTQLVKYLQERAEGNPFFPSELLRALEEEGRIRHTADGEWALAGLERLSVPPLVRQVIDGRLNRLGEGIREALEVACVIGQDVPLTLWAAVSGMTESDLAMVIRRAVEAHLLDDARDGATLRFSHALVRETLYEGWLLPRRRALHLQVSDELITTSSLPATPLRNDVVESLETC